MHVSAPQIIPFLIGKNSMKNKPNSIFWGCLASFPPIFVEIWFRLFVAASSVGENDFWEAWYLACCNMGFANCWSDDYTPERCCPWPPQTPAPGSGIDLVFFWGEKTPGGLRFVRAEATWWCKHLGELNFGRFEGMIWFFGIHFVSCQNKTFSNDNMHVWEWQSKNTKAISTRSRLSIGPISRRDQDPAPTGQKPVGKKLSFSEGRCDGLFEESPREAVANLRATWAEPEPTEEVTRGSRTFEWKKRYEEKI